MKTLTDDDGNKYELIAEYGHEVLGLKPLPKRPEAEKRLRYIVQIYTFDTPVAKTDELFEYYHWTPHQAQLAADAVEELLAFIQGKEKFTNTTAELMVKARNAIKGDE